jgi:hypothetical protein
VAKSYVEQNQQLKHTLQKVWICSISTVVMKTQIIILIHRENVGFWDIAYARTEREIHLERSVHNMD